MDDANFANFSVLLSNARKLKGVSLRDVAKETGISNAYISQLETGAIDEPSPHKLRKLADYYGLSYTQLMEAAGYLNCAIPQHTTRDLLQTMVLDGQNLTVEEAIAVASYLAEYRRRAKAAGSLKTAFKYQPTKPTVEIPTPKPAAIQTQAPAPGTRVDTYQPKPGLTFGVTD